MNGWGVGPGSGRPLPSRRLMARTAHVVVAEDLTGQAHARQTTGRQRGDLRLGPGLGLAADKFHAARRAPCASAAGVQLIDPRVLLQREDKALSFRHVKRADVLDGQVRHTNIIGRIFF